MRAQRCPHCERRLPITGELAGECRNSLRLRRFFSGNTYSNPLLRAAVDGLKFHGIRDAAEHLGGLMAYAILAGTSGTRMLDTAVVPVPLHASRLRERGFNQSELLATSLAPALRLRILHGVLVRREKTRQQARLERDARSENVRNAFQATQPIHFSRIILVDDVATTGATLREAARALRRSGAREVWGVVAAQG